MKVILVNQPRQTAHLGNTKQGHGIFRVIRKKHRGDMLLGIKDLVTSWPHPAHTRSSSSPPSPSSVLTERKLHWQCPWQCYLSGNECSFFFFFTFQIQDQWNVQKEIDMNCKGPQMNMPEDVGSKKTWSVEIGQQKLQARYFLIEVHVEDIRFPLVN